ncbi:MAG: hypothetical protein AB7O04_12115 [Hyphomonadaceae bacterium]
MSPPGGGRFFDVLREGGEMRNALGGFTSVTNGALAAAQRGALIGRQGLTPAALAADGFGL